MRSLGLTAGSYQHVLQGCSTDAVSIVHSVPGPVLPRCSLWESAFTTARSLPARLAVEHCVHEARGLDVLPNTVHKFRSNGDEETAALLWDVIYAVRK